tara:strand:+ start:2498 stop:4555 length:2058 start_codon:yes stop_codon:yes gene_type:complete
MAIRLKVEFSALQVQVTKQEFASLQASSDTTTLLEFVNLKTRLDFIDLSTVLTLDSDTKNLYFMASLDSPNAETITFTDTDVRSVGLGKSDSTSVGDQDPAKAFNLGKSDTPTISESLSRVVQYVRGFTDSPSMSEDITSKDTSLGKSDSPTVTEDLAKLFSSIQADTTSVSEQAVRSVDVGKTDSVTFTDPIEVEVDLSKSDSVSFSDTPSLETAKVNTDTLSVSESDVKLVGKNVDDGSQIPTTKTYTVTVASATNSYGSGNKYHIDGLSSPGLILNSGFTYTFDQSDSSNSGHPLRFSTTANGTHGSGSEYTTNVTTNGTPGSSGAYTRITISDSTPSLHYYCTNHSGMGAATSTQSSSDTNFAVTVASGVNNYGSGNKYYIDGIVSPLVHLVSGNTYTFDTSASSNSGHPFRFSETANGSHNSGTEYTTGVTTNGTAGSSGAYTRIQVTNSTATTLFYYCTNHSGMGGEINSSVSTGGDIAMSESLARIVSYIRTFTDAAAMDDTASASDDLATESGINKNNVFSVSDAPTFAVGKPGVSDSFNVSESAALSSELVKSDSVGPSDATPVFSISLAPSDSLSLSEVLSLGGQNVFSDQISVTESTNLNSADGVQDSTSIVESLASAFNSNRSDSLIMSEQSVLTFSKSLSDNATISESVSILFIPGGGSILNTAALNTFVLN